MKEHLLWYCDQLDNVEAGVNEYGTNEVSFQHLIPLFAVTVLQSILVIQMHQIEIGVTRFANQSNLTGLPLFLYL